MAVWQLATLGFLHVTGGASTSATTAVPTRSWQPSEDATFAVAVKHTGWEIAYDPAAAVDHFSGVRDEPRYYSGIVKTVNGDGVRDFVHNEIVCLWNAVDTKPRWLSCVTWSVLVGTQVAPGLLQAILLTRWLGLSCWIRFGHIQRGKLAGLWTMLSSKGETATANTERQSAEPQNAGQITS